MSTTKKLRLGPLPKTESTKLTFACPATLKADFDRYAAMHAQTYGEIGWAHNLLILSRCKDAQEREFYLRMTRKFGWSKNVLKTSTPSISSNWANSTASANWNVR